MRVRIFSFLILTTIFCSNAFSQIFDKSRGKNVLSLIQSPVIVHTTGSMAFDDRLLSSFRQYWTVSSFQPFDPAKEYGKSGDSSYAAFMPTVVGLVISRQYSTGGTSSHGTSLNFPFFVYGPAYANGDVSGDALVAAMPINCYHYEFNVKEENMFERSLLRLPYMVKTLNEMLAWIKDKGNEKGYIENVNSRATRLAQKTLIIPKDLVTEWDVNPNTTALMKGKLQAGKRDMREIMHQALDEGDITFSGKYKVMTTDEIMKLENSAEASKYALFLPAISEHKYIMAYDLKTKELLYYDEVTMGMKIKEKDFDKLNEAAGL